MKNLAISALVFLTLSSSVFALQYTGIVNKGHPVQCNDWGWTGQNYYYTIWPAHCETLSVNFGGDIKTVTVPVCGEEETKNGI